MSKPMTDERLKEIETDSANLHSHALRQELVDEIRRLRKELAQAQNMLADDEKWRKVQGERLAAHEKAMREAVKGEGRFSRDPLTHAENTIENMQQILRARLEES